MTGPAFARTLASLLLGAAAASAATATSVGSPRPHEVQFACLALTQLVADFNEGDPLGSRSRSYRKVYTDDLGEIEMDELDTFNASLLTSEGKLDLRPMTIQSIHALGGDEIRRQYVLTTERVRWRTKRYETDGMLQVVEVDDPHWSHENSYWLVAFNSNTLVSVREASELLHLKGSLEEVEGCPTDIVEG